MLKLTDEGDLFEHCSFMKDCKPKIGLTMRLEPETNRFYLGRDYCEALNAFGGLPVHLGLIPDENYIKGVIENLDGILLPGSNTDVDPYFYGEEPHPRLGTIIPEKDETDLIVLKKAEELKIPVLAICFGMQILNVFRGGALYQDISSQISEPVKHEQGSPSERKSHTIVYEEESLLARLITKDFPGKIRVNSSHHQAVKNIGGNLRATAWANDGVIECIEDLRSDRFVFGVQWHPEIGWKSDEVAQNIFRHFISECSNYCRSKTS